MRELTEKGLDLILEHEVGGGEPYYNAALQRPTWPEGQSGVTIGIGYDLGYNTEQQIRADWPMLPSDHRNRLCEVAGIKGAAANEAKRRVRDIVIPWALALRVFLNRTVPRFERQMLRAFPGAEQLPDGAYWALVSLVFNRGGALEGKNRQDMMDIHNILKDGVQKGDLAEIAKQLREMKRIWANTGQGGLLRRREDEARAVESCIPAATA